MTYTTLQRMTFGLFIAVAIALCAGQLIVAWTIPAAPIGVVAVMATVICAIPLLVLAVYCALQAMPGGRAVVPLPRTERDDSWILLLLCCEFTPAAALQEYVPAGWWGSMPKHELIGLLVLVLAVVARAVQLRMGVKVGAVVPDQLAEA